MYEYLFETHCVVDLLKCSIHFIAQIEIRRRFGWQLFSFFQSNVFLPVCSTLQNHPMSGTIHQPLFKENKYLSIDTWASLSGDVQDP